MIMRSSILSLMALCFATALAQIGANCNVVANQTVKAGDTLAAIAKTANVTLDQIQFVNTQITNPRSINVGDIIKIPNTKCVAPAAKPLAEPTATCSNGTAKTITVVSGDTLIIIAKEKLGITLPALLAANAQIKNPDVLNVGDVINVPLCNNGTSTGGANNSNTGSTTATKFRTSSISSTGMKPSKTMTSAGNGPADLNAVTPTCLTPTKSDGPKAIPADGDATAQAAEPTKAPR
ncbi:hypothetical protein ONS95_003154 [Cadophora gregata]|uniref:uncharacterized protein n=1 Tax=Cadophora gregata TaxID=51156 RepID=UPI0026DD46D4|nr:uncharacterized protein ONS95_003154 [Cadophora gregata]KAK0108339.1 hypothetical protein ONS95_003154 [Cadophora gregata]KAK0109070.1 hypothetical protein ONS96_002899 [Cadophora gregata f. sp. sojae]